MYKYTYLLSQAYSTSHRHHHPQLYEQHRPSYPFNSTAPSRHFPTLQQQVDQLHHKYQHKSSPPLSPHHPYRPPPLSQPARNSPLPHQHILIQQAVPTPLPDHHLNRAQLQSMARSRFSHPPLDHTEQTHTINKLASLQERIQYSLNANASLCR